MNGIVRSKGKRANRRSSGLEGLMRAKYASGETGRRAYDPDEVREDAPVSYEFEGLNEALRGRG